MLIEKTQYQAGDIVTFKLYNGDEVVAKIISENTDSWHIDRPTTVVPSQKGIMLVATLFTGEPDSRPILRKDHVLLHTNTVKEVRDHYIEQTTGIRPVSAGGIIAGI